METSHDYVSFTPEQTPVLVNPYLLAFAGLPVLLFYAVSQAVVGLLIGPQMPELKLVLECPLLMIGLILHVQWRKTTTILRSAGLPRPKWIAAADCLSFVITFWALCILASVFAN